MPLILGILNLLGMCTYPLRTNFFFILFCVLTVLLTAYSLKPSVGGALSTLISMVETFGLVIKENQFLVRWPAWGAICWLVFTDPNGVLLALKQLNPQNLKALVDLASLLLVLEVHAFCRLMWRLMCYVLVRALVRLLWS